MPERSVERITRDELETRGYEGVSECRCETDEGDWVPCPPLLCEAQRLLDDRVEGNHLMVIYVLRADAALDALSKAVQIIHGLEGQQAIADDWYKDGLAEVEKTLEEMQAGEPEP